jgi:CBS domain-containing protein
MKVRDVASSAVVAVGPAQSLREAAQLMAKHRVGSAVVQDAEMLIGILTERSRPPMTPRPSAWSRS